MKRHRSELLLGLILYAAMFLIRFWHSERRRPERRIRQAPGAAEAAEAA